MADVFSNSLRVREQESGSNAGTWGGLLNTTIRNIASAFGQGSETIPNASTHTITLADGVADEARSMYLKCTGGGQACTVTLAPNTVSKVWIISNETSFTLTFTQGSGANVAVAAGAVKMIVTDGAGSGAAVTDALSGLDASLSGLTVDTTTLVVDATNNRVGIGTSSPSAKLTLNDAGQQVGIDFKEAGTTRAHIEYDGAIPALELGTNGAANVVLKTNNTERMGIDSSGNVDITTGNLFTDATSGIFFSGGIGSFTNGIYGVGVNNVAINAGGSERMRLTTTGLGVGTTTVLAKIHVAGSPQATTGALAFLRNGDATSSNTSFGGIHFSSSPGTDFSIGKANVNSATSLSFRNGNTGASLMDLTSAGNVGIGTSSPNSVAKLQVEDITASNTSTYISVVSGNGGNAGIAFGDSDSDLRGGVLYNNADNALRFFGKNAFSEAMRIDSSGNVGIGNSNPAAFNSLGGKQVVIGSGAEANTLTLFSDDTNDGNGYGHVAFADSSASSSTAQYAGLIQYFHGDNTMRFYTNATERMRITSGGTTGFFGAAANTRSDITLTTGTSDSSKRWGFGGGATGNNAVFYVINESNVGVYLAHGGQAWVAHSDERIKENVVSVGTVLPSLMNMRCVKYNLISNPTDTKIGFIAQDWESAFPEVIDENEHLVLEADGTIGTDDDSDSTTAVKAMAYTETIPLLLKAIQEQQATITALEARITQLENN